MFSLSTYANHILRTLHHCDYLYCGQHYTIEENRVSRVLSTYSSKRLYFLLCKSTRKEPCVICIMSGYPRCRRPAACITIMLACCLASAYLIGWDVQFQGVVRCVLPQIRLFDHRVVWFTGLQHWLRLPVPLILRHTVLLFLYSNSEIIGAVSILCFISWQDTCPRVRGCVTLWFIWIFVIV